MFLSVASEAANPTSVYTGRVKNMGMQQPHSVRRELLTECSSSWASASCEWEPTDVFQPWLQAQILSS